MADEPNNVRLAKRIAHAFNRTSLAMDGHDYGVDIGQHSGLWSVVDETTAQRWRVLFEPDGFAFQEIKK